MYISVAVSDRCMDSGPFMRWAMKQWDEKLCCHELTNLLGEAKVRVLEPGAVYRMDWYCGCKVAHTCRKVGNHFRCSHPGSGHLFYQPHLPYIHTNLSIQIMVPCRSGSRSSTAWPIGSTLTSPRFSSSRTSITVTEHIT